MRGRKLILCTVFLFDADLLLLSIYAGPFLLFSEWILFYFLELDTVLLVYLLGT